MRRHRIWIIAALILTLVMTAVPASAEELLFAGTPAAAAESGTETAAMAETGAAAGEEVLPSGEPGQPQETTVTDPAAGETTDPGTQEGAGTQGGGEAGSDEGNTPADPAVIPGGSGTDEVPGEENPAEEGTLPAGEISEETVIPGEESSADPAAAGEEETPSEEETEEEEKEPVPPSVFYRTRLTTGAWSKNKKDGAQAGTVSAGMAINRLRIRIEGDADLGVTYQVKINGKGWQDYTADNTITGIASASRHVEAIRVSLTGSDADKYDVYYCTYVSSLGWLGWAKNGAKAGSEGYEYAVSAIAVKLVPKGEAAPAAKGSTTAPTKSRAASIKYTTYMNGVGWKDYSYNGSYSGKTTARLEGIKVVVDGAADLGISYAAHVEGSAWPAWSSDGTVSGAVGKGKKINIFRAKLTGVDASKYDLYYSVYVQRVGWMNWTKNGSYAGTSNYNLEIRAIRMKILKKGAAAPAQAGETSLAYMKGDPSILSYRVRIKGKGWPAAVSGGKTAGATGSGYIIEGFKAALVNQPYAGSIQYRAYLANTEWTGLYADNAIAGGSGKRVEAVRLRLTGEMADYYDLYYRVHVENFGWTGWASNYARCGSIGYGYRIDAMEISIRHKLTGAPGGTGNQLFNGTTIAGKMLAVAQGYGSNTGYIILVNRSTHTVLLCTGSRGNWKQKYFWQCGDGAPETPTVEGVFSTAYKTLYFGHPGEYRCWYATQFYGDYLLHSIKYYDEGSPAHVLDGRLGMGVSQGCVRLKLENAKWIYDNIPTGTTVVVYH